MNLSPSHEIVANLRHLAGVVVDAVVLGLLGVLDCLDGAAVLLVHSTLIEDVRLRPGFDLKEY